MISVFIFDLVMRRSAYCWPLVGHHAAMAYEDVAAFLGKSRDRSARKK
jgi:hypothetical protein